MHYYINWALCNLPTFILPGRTITTVTFLLFNIYLLYLFIIDIVHIVLLTADQRSYTGWPKNVAHFLVRLNCHAFTNFKTFSLS